MSLKSKLITTISMFVLVLAMTIVGVFAVTSATINMGGNITFVADDINAIVTGKIEGANETHVLDTLTYSATQEPEGDVSTWVGNNLTFKQDTKEPIKITVTVENKSTERWLIVRVEDKTGTIENLNRGITKGGSSYTQNTDVALKPSTGDRTSEVEFVITLSLADSNKSVASAPYSYIIHLNNSNEEPEQPAEPQELDFTFAGGMVSGYNGTETDITLPSSYSLVEVPLNELEVSLDEYYTEQGAAILNAFSGYDVLLANEYKFENVTNQDDLNQKLEQYIQDQGVEVEACFPIKVIYKTEPIIEYTYDEYQRDGDILDGRGETVYKDFFVYLIREMFKFSYAGGEYQTFGIEEFQNYYYLEILDKNGGTIPESYFPLKFKF